MKKRKYIVALFALMFSFQACESFLDEQPVSEIPAEEMWQTARDAKAGVNQIYGFFRSATRTNYFYWGEFRGDNFEPGSPSAADQGRVMDNLMTTDQSSSHWGELYKVINQANLAIKYLPTIDMPSVSEREDLLGQAYAMRALAYLYAIRVWGDVPLFIEPNEQYSPDIYRSRSDKDEILRDVILEDLKMAEGLIDRHENKERKRISIFGVWAILTDTYMMLEEYSNADQTVTKMTTYDPDFMAFEPDIMTWKKMFTEELNAKAPDNTPDVDEYTTKEFIFVLHYHMEEVGSNGYSYMYQWFTGGGNRAGVVSESLRSKFEEGDARYPIVVKEYQGGFEMRKYILGDISSTLNKSCQIGYPIYRFSDMMLLQAEALARMSKWSEALDLVKKIRTRAGIETKSAVEFNSEDELIDYILDERQRELVGEGRRWFDLLRTGKWKEVMEPINGMSQAGNEFFPIHYSHIDQNPKIVQNPYYVSSN